jgi:GT2 family glycosyltransferase
MTYLSIDETYNVDAISGAFMFCRKEVLDQTGGFDPDYFMYGEDIDLCYRTSSRQDGM